MNYIKILCFSAVITGLGMFFKYLPLWKIIGSKNVAVGVAACQLIGFPATYLVVNEIINAVAETEEEKKIIHERLMAKYLVAGFVTVTTFSVIVAGIFVKFI